MARRKSRWKVGKSLAGSPPVFIHHGGRGGEEEEEEAKEGDLRNLSKARGGGGKFSRKAVIVNRPPLKRFEDFSRGREGRQAVEQWRIITGR